MTISDLQISVGQWHAGLTQASHLSTFFLTKPDIASEVITRVYNMQNGYKNTLSFLTSGLGKSKELNNIVYRWPMMGDSRKAISITGNYSDGGSTPGLNFTTFRVKVAENFFVLGDNLVPDDTDYQLRVDANPEQIGSEWILTLKLVTNDSTDFIPAALLAAGKQLSKDFNSVEHDMSRTSGETHYATPFMLENYMTTFRKKYSVSGAAQEKVLEIGLMDPASKKVSKTWVKYAEWEFWSQWMDEIEKMLMFGKSNVLANGQPTTTGASGNKVYQGAGLEQQISLANKRYYTTLTENTIRDFMNDLAFNGTEGGPRKYVALCGRQFMDLFDRAMKTSASNYTLVDSKFVTGSGQELSLGGQFTTYRGLNGDEITLKEYSAYNEMVRNRQLHPQTGKPVESYKATFINFKEYKGESNVMKVYHKGREFASTYIEGMCSPFGMKKNGTSASPVDGYEFHAMGECGIMLKDGTDAAQLILDVDSIS